MWAKCGGLTGGGVLDEEADHVAERGAPLGDTGQPPQGALLHHLGTGEAVESQVVLLLEELLGPRGEAYGRGQHSESGGGSPHPAPLPCTERKPPCWPGFCHLSQPQRLPRLGSSVKQQCLAEGDTQKLKGFAVISINAMPGTSLFGVF